MQTANPRSLRIVFVLGPFFDRDEAQDVESQAHKLLAEHRVRGEWFDMNPLVVPEFWEWIDAQILPLCVHEKSAIPRQPAEQKKSIGSPEQRWRRKYGDPYRRGTPIQGSFDLG